MIRGGGEVLNFELVVGYSLSIFSWFNFYYKEMLFDGKF